MYHLLASTAILSSVLFEIFAQDQFKYNRMIKTKMICLLKLF